MTVLAIFVFDSSHSHATFTRHPSFPSSLRTLRSRTMFLSNFSSQNFTLVLGVDAILHPTCRCQKHPWTKIATPWRGRTMSGLPESPAPPSRYRKPRRCSSFLSAISGLVSLEGMRDIRSERCTGVRKSTTCDAYFARDISSKNGNPRTISPCTSKDLYRHWWFFRVFILSARSACELVNPSAESS
jgi:hypothetical protein